MCFNPWRVFLGRCTLIHLFVPLCWLDVLLWEKSCYCTFYMYFAFTQPIHSHGSVRIIYDFLFLLLIYFRHKLRKSLLACYCGCRWRCTKPCSKSCPRSLFSFLVVVIFSRVTKSPAVRRCMFDLLNRSWKNNIIKVIISLEKIAPGYRHGFCVRKPRERYCAELGRDLLISFVLKYFSVAVITRFYYLSWLSNSKTYYSTCL